MRYSAIFPANFHGCWQYKIRALVSYFATMKYSAQTDLKPSIRRQGMKVQQLTVPELTKDRIQKLDSLMTIAVAYNYVSWAKISIPTLTLLDWNCYTLPNFQKHLDEIVILQTAHNIISDLPSSELYILESQSGKWIRNYNDSSLKIMLTSLLSSRDGNSCDKIVFQNPSVLNKLHNLLVGGERVSPKGIIEQKLGFHFRKYETFKQNDNSDCYSLIDVDPKQIQCFKSYQENKQGSLSLALLIALSFIDLNIFSNPEIFHSKKRYLKS